MKLLIVDDSRVAQFHLQSLLADAGYDDVLTADSAGDAFRLLGMQPSEGSGEPIEVDLILLDVVMPNVSGVEVCRRIKSDDRLRDVPVIMVTAQTETEHLTAAFAAGAMDYITKPANEVELLARVRSALRLKSETDQRKAREMEVNAQLQRALAAEQALAEANARLTDQALALAAELERRQQAEATLRESEARYRAVVEHSADGIAILTGMRYVYVNGAFLHMHGLHGETQAVGQPVERFVAPDDAPDLAARAAVWERGDASAGIFEYRLRRADGEERTVEAAMVPISYQGRPAALAMLRDITERRALERMRDEFLSMVSHELRSPITSIKGYTDLLLEEGGERLGEEQREFLDVVRRNADRLLSLVNDILDLSRIEAGQMQLHRTTISVRGAVGEVARAFQPQIEAKRQSLSLALDDGLPTVFADPQRVAQVITNLVSNAHKYTPEGGQITVGARYEERDTAVRVEVRDTGIGLAEEEQQRLFSKFFRSSNRAARDAGGTGLGLAITRALVEMQGGEIGVQSAPGSGSTFWFTVPVTAADAGEPGSESGESATKNAAA